MKHLKQIQFIILILFPFFIFSQNSFELYGKTGISNINEVNYSEHEIIANSFDFAFSYDIGGLYVRSFSDELFKIKTGIGLSSIATKMGVKDLTFIDGVSDFDNTQESIQRYNYLYIPLEFSYAFEKWIYLNIGADNKFLVAKPKSLPYNEYVFSLMGGFSLKLSDNYLVGFNYNRDLTPISGGGNSPISYYSNQFTIKFSYVLL